jgi:hypothetical protein
VLGCSTTFSSDSARKGCKEYEPEHVNHAGALKEAQGVSLYKTSILFWSNQATCQCIGVLICRLHLVGVTLVAFRWITKTSDLFGSLQVHLHEPSL